jgi:hypothetical protein
VNISLFILVVRMFALRTNDQRVCVNLAWDLMW